MIGFYSLMPVYRLQENPKLRQENPKRENPVPLRESRFFYSHLTLL